MDAYQQSHRYTRPPLPPLPSMADPNQLHHHNQFAPPPRQQVHPQSPWYPGQFQYHPPSSSSSPPPPPPPHLHQQPQQQWAPPPHADQYPPPAYPPPHHHPLPPYPAHQPPHNQFPPPPRPHVLPPPPHNQPYPQVNQEWGSMNWAHQQGWEYPVHSNEEDWAARARAWATAKAAMDYQHPQSQFTPTGRPEEQIQYHDQHVQAVDSYYPQSQQQAHPAPGYLQFQAAPTHRSPGVHLQESGSMSSGPASFVPDGHSSYSARDGALAGDSNVAFPHQENMSASSTVHQQEVPSSYSSVTGFGVAGDQNDQLYKSLPLDITSQEGQHHVQSSVPAVGRSDLMDHSFAYGNHLADRPADLSDQPLDFAPRFNRGHEPHMQSSFPQPDSVGPIRGMDSGAVVPSIHAWAAPVAPGIAYPPIPPVLPAGPQHDPSLSGHATPLGRIPGPGFQATVPSSAPFGLGAGPAAHATAAYPGDAYGVPGMSDRPKKVAVPNWLREEIIKKKAVIVSSAHEQPKEETQSMEDEAFEKSLGKGDQADSKSIDSSRSTEEEDDDEDYVEAARTAAINQEIKRILTEVLLKVTDELFDEIATKVLSEDDLMVEVDQDTKASNQRASVSPPAVPTPKPSTKVLIPLKSKETESRDASEKSTSSSRADVLGLGSYASDDDDDEIQTSDMPNSRENTVHKQLSMKKDSEDVHEVGENGSSQPEIEEHDKRQAHLEDVPNKSAVVSKLKHGSAAQTYSSELSSEVTEGNVGRKVLDGINKSEFKHGVGEKVVKKPEPPGEDVNAEKLKSEYPQSRESGIKSEKNGGYETQRNSTGKDSIEEVGSGKIKADGKVDENHVKQEERCLGKTKDGNVSKERKKGEGARPEGKVKESDSKTRSIYSNGEEDSKETERGRRHSAKEDSGKKREMAKDEKEDRSKHKPQSDSSRHKRRRSPSPGRRGRHRKNDAVVSHANDTSDEASEDSRRKVHEKRRNLSPSPVKSRRRQLSRSPHSKHSQRRHSPYSSLETTRKRRSRSRSPIRRQR